MRRPLLARASQPGPDSVGSRVPRTLAEIRADDIRAAVRLAYPELSDARLVVRMLDDDTATVRRQTSRAWRWSATRRAVPLILGAMSPRGSDGWDVRDVGSIGGRPFARTTRVTVQLEHELVAELTRRWPDLTLDQALVAAARAGLATT